MIKSILNKYQNYKVTIFNKLKFTYDDYLSAIKLIDNNIFEKKLLGKSFEDRAIYLFRAGKGKTKIILWSQMHGNEPISTQGLLDFMFFLQKNDKNNKLREQILSNCTIFCIPLVNPDGCERFCRRNAQGIDLNRDALKKNTPEAKLLDNIIEQIQPDFAFNLHDQERYYGTAQSLYPTALSFLTPAFDFEKTIDKHREKSMKLIASIYNMLQDYLPKRIAKYNDNFMPNAFGDNVQKKNIATILFEAGYIPNDEQRQEVRKFYFASITYALLIISDKSYEQNLIKIYDSIPLNHKFKFYDYIFKNVTIKQKNKTYTTDIAVKKKTKNSEQFSDLVNDYIISDIGDLENLFAFRIIDYSGKQVNNENFIIEISKKADFLFNED